MVFVHKNTHVINALIVNSFIEQCELAQIYKAAQKSLNKVREIKSRKFKVEKRE